MPTKFKSIPLSGLSTSPSDYTSPDGHLSAAIGVFHHDNAVTPIKHAPKDILDEGKYHAIYQHKVNGGELSVIIERTNSPVINPPDTMGQDRFNYVVFNDSMEPVYSNGYFKELYYIKGDCNVSSVGNTLIFQADGKNFYYLWEDGGYRFLGNEIPRHDCAFELICDYWSYYIEGNGEHGATFSGPKVLKEWFIDSDLLYLKDEYITDFSNAVFAAINDKTHELHKNGLFTQPFLATLCYRLYDGNYITVLNPTLMIPSTLHPIFSIYHHASVSMVEVPCSVLIPAAKLAVHYFSKADLSSWSDIVKGVEIFVTPPLYQYDQGAECKRVHKGGIDIKLRNTYCVGRSSAAAEGGSVYRKRTMLELFEDCLWKYDTSGYSNDNYADLPTPSIPFHQQVYEAHTFYKKCSDLNVLTSQESLPNDFFSMDAIYSDFIGSYNGRLNMAGIHRTPTSDFSLRNMVAYQDASPDGSTDRTNYQVSLKIKENGKTITVNSRIEEMPTEVFIPYLYHHDPGVETIKIATSSKSETISPIKHDFLNGVVYFGEQGLKLTQEEGGFPSKGASGSFYNPSQIYTSDIGNPFTFRASNVEQVGSGRIIALVPAAQALSQGQFGEFPMYAFTTDGIWALYVNDTGGWSSKQPISRDVAINRESILQLDQSVIFATERGLMQISGSSIECISEVFDGNPDTFLSNMAVLGHINSTFSRAKTDLPTLSSQHLVPFRQFLQGCNMHYDYPGQRIIIGNAAYPFSYVFGLKDKLWTAQFIPLSRAINSYPHALAVSPVTDGDTVSNHLIDLSAPGSIPMPSSGIIITRPLKIDGHDTLKTLRTIQLRGQFAELTRINHASVTGHHVYIVVYATNDTSLRQWHMLGTACGPRIVFRYGSPFKYFRLAILTNLTEGESIDSIDIEYEIKENDKIR